MTEYQTADETQSKNNRLSPDPLSSTTPQISVIIPAYNSARFLPQALASVFAQEGATYEIIVVDDGSTDDTRAVLFPYADRIRYVCQANTGSAAARNRGLTMARGAFIVFLDADDLLLPGKFEVQLRILEERPSLGMVHSGWHLVNEAGAVIKTVEPWHVAPELDLETWLRKKPVKMGAMLFRRQWLQRVGGLDPELRQSQDVDLMLRLALAGCSAAWVRQPTMCYRHHPGSTIRRNARQQAFYVTRVLDKFFSHPNVPPELRRRERETRYYSALWQAWHLFRTDFLPESVTYLRRSLRVTPYDARRTMIDWVRHFAKWAAREGRAVDDVARMWPYFREAAPQPQKEWPRMQRLLSWWLAAWPASAAAAWSSVDFLWTLMEKAADYEHVVSLEQFLSWWLHIWSGYVEGVPVAEQWARFQALAAAELVDLARISMVVAPDCADVAMIGRFWRDVTAQRPALPDGKRLATSLYLTFAGQKLMGRKWRESGVGFVHALRQGIGPQARAAWRHFLQAGAAYLRQRPDRSQEVDG